MDQHDAFVLELDNSVLLHTQQEFRGLRDHTCSVAAVLTAQPACFLHPAQTPQRWQTGHALAAEPGRPAVGPTHYTAAVGACWLLLAASLQVAP